MENQITRTPEIIAGMEKQEAPTSCADGHSLSRGKKLPRDASVIAEEINSIKSQTSAILGAAFAVARQSCFEIGKRLEEAKCLVAYGQWGAWLSENVAYSESTANNLMRIYREFGDEQIDMLTGKSPRDVFGDLSQSQLVELFALPPAERITYVEEHREEMEEQSIRELHQQIAEYKDALEAERKRSERLLGDLDGYKDDLADAQDQLKAAKVALQKKEHEPVEATVIVNQPSEEQIEQLRATIGAEYEAEYKDILAERSAKLHEAEIEADKLREADKKKLEKLAAEHEKELEEARKSEECAKARVEAVTAEYEKKLCAANAQTDVRSQRVAVYLSDVGRLIGLICTELDGMESEQAGAGARMRAKIAASIDRALSERGLTV